VAIRAVDEVEDIEPHGIRSPCAAQDLERSLMDNTISVFAFTTFSRIAIDDLLHVIRGVVVPSDRRQ
jgi:hypothetical protein